MPVSIRRRRLWLATVPLGGLAMVVAICWAARGVVAGRRVHIVGAVLLGAATPLAAYLLSGVGAG